MQEWTKDGILKAARQQEFERKHMETFMCEMGEFDPEMVERKEAAERKCMQDWAKEELETAAGALVRKQGIDPCPALMLETQLELQCEVTALREGLEVLLEEHNCDYGDVDYDGTKTECDTCTPIKELLARIPQ